MRRTLITPILIATLLAPAATLAGHGKGKACEQPVDECLNAIVTKLKSTGFIGVEVDEEAKKDTLVVTSVVPDSPAEKVGIRPGDELVALNDISFGKDSREKMAEVKKPGNEVTCTIRREGVKKSMKLTLVPMPADLMAKYIGEHMMMIHEAQAERTAMSN